MGMIASKTLQDAALLFGLSGIPNVTLYSDNIIIRNQTMLGHLDSIKLVLHRLRNHGLKVKSSKCAIFTTGRIGLYGFILDLQSGKIFPDEDKIKGLMTRKVPSSKKDLKSFFGGLTFYSQLIPLAGDQISCLHRVNRGARVIWSDEAQVAFEHIQFLLTESKLLFLYSPDHSKQVCLSVDSSWHHSALQILQLCPNNHPCVLGYIIKSWGEAFQSLIPALKELIGLCTALKAVQPHFESGNFPLKVFVDSLPIYWVI